MLFFPLWHLVLIPLYPVLQLYSANLFQVIASEIYLPLIFMLAVAFIFFLTMKIITGNKYAAALFTSYFIFLTFAFGQLYRFLLNFLKLDSWLKLTIFYALFLFILFLLFRSIRKNKNKLLMLNKLFTVFGLLLISLPMITIALYHFSIFRTKNKAEHSTEIQNFPKLGEKPDIYYLIFDRYASYDSLSKYFNYDNSKFYRYLNEKGFIILNNSWANYTSSAHSLASSLNMDYLDNLQIQEIKDSRDWNPIYNLVQNHRVGQILKKNNYKYYHVGSWWWPTSKNKLADKNLNLSLVSEFSNLLISNTVFYPLIEQFHLPYLDNRYTQYRRILNQFKEIKKVAADKNPKFVFSHLIIPHEPYVFKTNGDFLTAEDEKKMDYRSKYRGQLNFLNSQLINLVESILTSSKGKAIIILQADEGPYPEKYEAGKDQFDWTKAFPDEIEEKMSILNAIYLPRLDRGEPDNNYGQFKDNESPVNTFRLIFNEYFDTNYNILPDYYRMSNMSYPYSYLIYEK